MSAWLLGTLPASRASAVRISAGVSPVNSDGATAVAAYGVCLADFFRFGYGEEVIEADLAGSGDRDGPPLM